MDSTETTSAELIDKVLFMLSESFVTEKTNKGLIPQNLFLEVFCFYVQTGILSLREKEVRNCVAPFVSSFLFKTQSLLLSS